MPPQRLTSTPTDEPDGISPSRDTTTVPVPEDVSSRTETIKDTVRRSDVEVQELSGTEPRKNTGQNSGTSKE
jgi:hypothetical protein